MNNSNNKMKENMYTLEIYIEVNIMEKDNYTKKYK